MRRTGAVFLRSSAGGKAWQDEVTLASHFLCVATLQTRQETPVPSMVTLHTAHTGAFFRKTFSRKLCGSAFLGCGWDDRQTEV